MVVSDKKRDLYALLITLGVIFFIAVNVLVVELISANYNELYHTPRNIDCTVDVGGYELDDLKVATNLSGKFEFFYNKWIITDNYTGEADAIVEVPHRWSGMELNGTKLDRSGYASYRITVVNLKQGDTVRFLLETTFVGAYRAYFNGQLCTSYGEMKREGFSTSNGAPESEINYTVQNADPIVIVIEIGASSEGGLHSAPWLASAVRKSLYWLARNIGLFALGVLCAMFIFSLILNIGQRREERLWTFSILLLVYILQFIFSVDLYWRICESTQCYLFNIVIDANYVINLFLVASGILHLVKSGALKLNKATIIGLCVLYAGCTAAFFALGGSNYRTIPIFLEAIGTCFLVYPLAKGAVSGKKYNIVYLFLFYFNMLSVMCAVFDFMDVVSFGLDVVSSVGIIIDATIITVMYLLMIRENTRRAFINMETERENRRIKAEALRAQIKPHFVFNSLASIQDIYLNSLEKGNLAITRFSKHLRANIEASNKEMVPFSEELNNILNYIELENMRYESEINVLLNTEFLDFSVPILSLQPFVENAIKYSKIGDKEDGYIEINSYETADGYVIEVEDNGIGFCVEKVKPASTGLKNATERLALLTGASVLVDSQEGRGTKITITIPKE